MASMNRTFEAAQKLFCLSTSLMNEKTHKIIHLVKSQIRRSDILYHRYSNNLLLTNNTSCRIIFVNKNFCDMFFIIIIDS